jgi:hypothetical protein
LIRFCEQRGEGRGRNEYFSCLDYSEARDFAETLRYDPPPHSTIEERIALNLAEDARLRENVEARSRFVMQHRRAQRPDTTSRTGDHGFERGAATPPDPTEPACPSTAAPSFSVPPPSPSLEFS